jgi:hypothetical protein
MTALFQFLIIFIPCLIIALGWTVWKYRRDLILGWLAYMAFKFYTRHMR